MPRQEEGGHAGAFATTVGTTALPMTVANRKLYCA